MQFLLVPLVSATDKFNTTYNDPAAMNMPGALSMILNLLIGLVVIVGLAYITVKFFRKNMPNTSATGSIVILDQFGMGMNKGLFITEIAGKILVLGISDHAVNVVTEITDEKQIAEIRRLSSEVKTTPVWPETWVTWGLKKVFKSGEKPGNSFNSHIQEQIKKLQSLGSNGKENNNRHEEEGND